MTKHPEPTKAQHLAGIVSGTANTSTTMATVQRSHRFPLHIFVIIENLAKKADCSVSAMINQLLEVGMESLLKELPEEIGQEIHHVTQEQIDKANSSVSQTLGKKK
jgi:hypothetical protein